MDIPSTPGWETQSTEMNGEPKIFVTSFYIELEGKQTEFGGRLVAKSWEEAQEIARAIKFPRTEVLGVLGGSVNLYMMN